MSTENKLTNIFSPIDNKLLNFINLIIAVSGLFVMIVFLLQVFFLGEIKFIHFFDFFIVLVIWGLYFFRNKINIKVRKIILIVFFMLISLPTIPILGIKGGWGYLAIFYSFLITLFYGRRAGELSVLYSMLYMSILGYLYIIKPLHIDFLLFFSNKGVIYFVLRVVTILVVSLLIVYATNKYRIHFIQVLNDLIKAKKDAEENKERYRFLSELTIEGILVHKDGKLLYANSSMERIFGYNIDEIKDKNVIKEFIKPEYHKLVFQNINKKVVDPYEVEGMRKDGTTIPLEVEARSIEDSAVGENVRVVALRDIRKRKTVEKKARLFSLAVQQSANTVIITDIEGHIEYVNSKFSEMTGYTAEEAKGKIPEVLLNIEDSNKICKDIKDAIIKGKSWKTEYYNNKKDGTKYWEQNVITPITDINGNLTNILIIKEDISLRKKAEEELKKQNEIYAALNKKYKVINEELIKAKQEAEENQGKYKKLSDITFEGIVIHENGIAIEINQALERIFGYSRDEILGKHVIKEFIKPEYHELIFKNIARQFTEPYEIEGIRKDGTIIPLEVAARYVQKYNGVENIHVVALRDISNRKKAESEIKKLSTAVEQSADAVIITDNKGTIEYVNHRFYEITGFTQKEIIGKVPNVLLFDKNKKHYAEIWEVIKNRESWKGEYLNKRKDGVTYWEQNTITPIVNDKGELTNILIIKEDISERKRVEYELKHQNDEYAALNEEYKTTNEELIIAKEKAEESDKLKSEFINNMSHEVRTPMNGILGFTELLCDKSIPEEARIDYARIVKNSGKRLMRIIDDIMEISRLGTNRVKIIEQEICLNDLLDELYKIFESKAKENNIELRLKKQLSDDKSMIMLDEIKLNKILGNLLENAFKFTNKGFVEFGYTLKGNDIEIYVKDTGTGIKKENLDLIFNRFSQEEKIISRKVDGLGLGLSIAKENTKLLGGDIRVESEKGKGSTFFVTIPYKHVSLLYNKEKETEFKQQNNTAEASDNEQKHTVLIVEDEEINYQYISALVNKFRINVKILFAENGKQAVDICKKEENIDLIFMDIRMPVMDGYKATKLIKEYRHKIPIVAQTAYSTKEDREKAIVAGCDDFIAKPINEKVFLRIINKFL